MPVSSATRSPARSWRWTSIRAASTSRAPRPLRALCQGLPGLARQGGRACSKGDSASPACCMAAARAATARAATSAAAAVSVVIATSAPGRAAGGGGLFHHGDNDGDPCHACGGAGKGCGFCGWRAPERPRLRLRRPRRSAAGCAMPRTGARRAACPGRPRPSARACNRPRRSSRPRAARLAAGDVHRVGMPAQDATLPPTGQGLQCLRRVGLRHLQWPGRGRPAFGQGLRRMWRRRLRALRWDGPVPPRRGQGCGRCSACGGAGCGLCGGKGGCSACGGAGCKLCCGSGLAHKLLGLPAGLVGKLFHVGDIKYFVGPGGPGPLTPGYVPNVVTTRSPRDFFAFPPFSQVE